MDEVQAREHRQFAQALLEHTLPPEQFDHAGHLRAAWFFIATLGPIRGAETCAGAIRAYAEALGATGKYHETLTMALLRLVAEAMTRPGGQDWSAFRTANPALFADVRLLLARHYSPGRLASEQAREQFLEPDLAPLPEWPGC